MANVVTSWSFQPTKGGRFVTQHPLIGAADSLGTRVPVACSHPLCLGLSSLLL